MKVHLNLATRHVDTSVAFFRTLLDAEPTKHLSDYALFITENPGLELALDADPNVAVGSDAHYGIAVDVPEAVDAAIARLRAAGQPLDIEVEQVCCYANQTKVWATDPDGRRWETYYVIEDTEIRDDPSCCSSDEEVVAANAADAPLPS